MGFLFLGTGGTQGAEIEPEVLWVRQLGGTNDQSLYGVKKDGAGSIYCGGVFSGTIYLGVTNLPTTHNNNKDGIRDGFIVKYSPDGAVVRASYFPSDLGMAFAASDRGETYYARTVDPFGTFIHKDALDGHQLWGNYISFGAPGAVSLGVDGSAYILEKQGRWLFKLDADGQIGWSSLSDTGFGGDGPLAGMCSDLNGNVYVVGGFAGSVSVASTNFTAVGTTDTLLAKFSPKGNLLWARTIGGDGEVSGRAVRSDSSGCPYVTGMFSSRITTFGNTNLASRGHGDMFVAKFDPDGKDLWLIQAGGLDDDFGTDIDLDAHNNIYVTGSFQGIATFGTNSLLTSRSKTEAFCAKFDPDGAFLGVSQMGGRGLGVQVSSDGYAYVGGIFYEAGQFGKTNLFHYGFEWTDSFLAKLDLRSPTIVTEPKGQFGSPGGTAQFTVVATGPGPLQYQWRRSGSDLIDATNSTLTITNLGTVDYASYSVVVRGAFGSVASSVVALARTAALSLTFDAPSIQESQTVGITLERASVTTDAVLVHLRSSLPSQLSVPESVIIPANAGSVKFVALAVDDSIMEPPQAVTVTASSDVTLDGSAVIVVEDDDIPSLALELAALSVSERDGINATTATLRLGAPKSFPVTVQVLSSNPSVAQVPKAVTIEANRGSVSFSVGVVDDNQVQGPQQVVLRASLAIGSPPVVVAQSDPVTLTVTDDDKPTLTIQAANDTLDEGLSPATSVTVTRNTGYSGNLEVALSTSDSGEAVLPVSVTIPAGRNSVTVPLRTLLDGVSDGNKTVILNATAQGFTQGQTTVVVTDIDLPDLVIVSAGIPTSGETGAKVTVPIVIRNQGLVATTNLFVERVFFSTDAFVGSDLLASQVPFNGSLSVAETNQQFVTVTLPENPGTYWLIVHADSGDSVHEGLESNNYFVSTNWIRVVASYRATVSVSQNILVSGSPVTISGAAFTGSGEPSGLVRLNVHILLNGTVRTIPVRTDSNGRFSTIFEPLPGEGGSYTVIAAYPGVQTPTDDGQGNTAHFTVLALRLETPSAELSLIEQTPSQVRLRVVNLTPLPIHNLKVQVVAKPDTLTVSSLGVEGGGALAASGEAFINFQAVATDAVIPRGELQLIVTSDEGAQAPGSIRYRVSRQRANLFADVSRLEASVVRTNQRTVQFTIGNNGMAASGDITLLFPPIPWMNSPQGQILPSLAPGETRAVTLSLTPDQTIALTEHRGSIVLSSSTSQLALPFVFRVVSDSLADLTVTTVDEYFYFADGKPRLSGALVRLLDPFSGAELRRSVSDTNGLAKFTSIMEGPYTLEASAPDHSAYRNTVFIQPGGLNERQIFLSRETVHYTWTVEPTDIPERFNIIVQTRFEANVPAPVIVVEPTVINIASLTEPGQQMQVNVKISNQGLVAWQGVKFGFDANANFEVKPLIEDIGTLAAHGELVVPVTITRLGGSPRKASVGSRVTLAGDQGGLLCEDISGRASGFVECSGHVDTAVGVVATTGCAPNPNRYQTPVGTENAPITPNYSPVALEGQKNCDDCADFTLERVGDEQRIICADETEEFTVECKNGHVTGWAINGQHYQHLLNSFTPPKSDLARLKYGAFHEPLPYDVVATCHCDKGDQDKSVSFSVLVPQVKLSVPGLDERDKTTKGVYLITNGDDDNQNGKPDLEEIGELPEENDLLKLELKVSPSGVKHPRLRFDFNGASSVRLYRDQSKKQRIGLEIELDQEESPTEIYLENVGEQKIPTDLTMQVTLSFDGGQCVDTLLLRLFTAKFELRVDEPVSGTRRPYAINDPWDNNGDGDREINPGHAFWRVFISDVGAISSLPLRKFVNVYAGFWPSTGLRAVLCQPQVPGALRLNDTTHLNANNVVRTFSIGAPELTKLLDWMNSLEQHPGNYHLAQRNCTTLTAEAASQVGVKLPLTTGHWPDASNTGEFVLEKYEWIKDWFKDENNICYLHGANAGDFGEDVREKKP